MYRTAWTVFPLLAATAFLAGCAATPQVVTLNPQPKVSASTEGQSVPVVLHVVDQRGSQVIGYQTHSNGNKKNPITTDQNLSRLLYSKLAAGLKRKGFETMQYAGASRQKPRLTVTLERLRYWQSGSGVDAKVHVSVQLAAAAVTAKQHYKSTYSIEKNKRRALLHTRKENEQLINQALGGVLQSLFEDHQLMSALEH